MKLAKERDASGIKTQNHWAYTYYVRDAQGNVMATYKRTFNEISGTQVTDKLALDETHLYGSSRIGLRDRSQDGIYTDVTYNYTAMNTDKSYHTTTTASTTHMPAVNTATPERKLGYKAYELVNHLGNVLVMVSDRKLIHTTSSVLDYYVADVKSANDYSAFGAPMPGRAFTSANYRYGFNGKENDRETVGTGEGLQDYGMRIYNPSLGRFLSVDPITSNYPMLTPYQFASNRPIDGIDLDGLEWGGVISPGAAEISIPRLTIPRVGPIIPPGTIPIPPISPVLPIPPAIPVQPVAPVEPIAPPVPYSPIDWNNPPIDPSGLSSDWKEVTHPKNQSGSREFENMKTGEKIRFDKGNPKKGGDQQYDHWHRYNPNSKNHMDKYLDRYGNPTPNKSGDSHIRAGYKVITNPPVIISAKYQQQMQQYNLQMRIYNLEMEIYKIELEKYFEAKKEYDKKMKDYKEKQEKYYLSTHEYT